MSTRKPILYAVAIAILAVFTYTEAGAILGDGVCDQTELQNFQCTQFFSGTTSLGTVEIIPSTDPSTLGQWPIPAICSDPTTSQNTPCTIFTYRFSGPSGDNQINFLISDVVQLVLFAGTTGCSQFITDGAGDPTTGFGKNVLTMNVCRVAFNTNPTPNLPPLANIFIATRPAVPARTAVQLKAGKAVAAGEILGPMALVPPTATTTETITRSDGATLTYQRGQGGNLISATASSGQVTFFASTDGNFCTPTTPGNIFVPPTGFTCQSISFATDRCILKGAGNPDPTWAFVGGTWMFWP